MFKLGWGHRTEFKDRGEGDTAHEIVVKCSNLGGDTAQNSKTEGRGTPHMKLWSNVQTWVGTPHRIQRQRGGDTAQKDRTDEKDRWGTPHKCCGWVAGWLGG